MIYVFIGIAMLAFTLGFFNPAVLLFLRTQVRNFFTGR